MAHVISDETLYLTADKSEVVKEGDERAAFLLVRAGSRLSEGDAKKYGIKKVTDEPAPYDAIADHEAKHGNETQAQAEKNRKELFKNAPDNKAVDNAPATKAKGKG